MMPRAQGAQLHIDRSSKVLEVSDHNTMQLTGGSMSLPELVLVKSAF